MRTGLTGFLGSALVLAAPVLAETAAAPAEDTDKLPTVVVTATRTARQAEDVPAAIDAVPVDTADRASLGVNVSEVLEAVPGVLARNRQNYAQDEQISIRGFGARSTFGVRGVRLFADGIPASMPDGQGQVSHFNLDSADRVEVLRGPFSALYGNSAGGVIQIFTADGREADELRLGLVGASYGMGRASVNARGSEGLFGYNLDFSHFQTDGYRDHSAARRESGNAKLSWDFGTRSLTVIANSVYIPDADDPLGVTRAQYEADPRRVAAVAEQFDTRKSVDQKQVGAIFEQAIGGAHTLRLMAYGGRREVEQYLAIPVATQSNPLHAGGVIDLDGDYAGADARWTYALDPIELTVGLNYDEQDQARRGYENFVGQALGVRGRLRRNENNVVDNFDQYAQATWRFAERWSLMAGVRHSKVSFDMTDRYVVGTNPDDSGSREYSATSPVAGLLFEASPDASFYASWGKGFETPTFNELGYRNDGGSGLNFGLLPARTRSGELGAKWRLGRSAALDVALFRADTDDEIAVATNAGGRTSYRNVGAARRQGAEAGLRLALSDDLSLRLAATWLEATFRSGFLTCTGTPCTNPTTPVAAGTRIPGVPRTDLHVGLTWGGEHGWRVGAQADYVSSIPVNDVGSESAPMSVVYAADVGYGFELPNGRLRSFVRVDNLFDRDYVGSVIVNDGNGRYYEPGSGRSIMLGLQWVWAR
ncbi:MAG: TonB-dependent receptor [Dokdonella sp.]|nr:TonB-dependent receptor [Dokdonella sp.]